MADAGEIFVGAGFAEDEEVLVHDEVKAVTAGGAGPAGGVGGVVLGFDDFFFERKANF